MAAASAWAAAEALAVHAEEIWSPMITAAFAPIDAVFAPLNAQANAVAGSIGFPADQFKYVVCLLLAYPLAFVHRYVAARRRRCRRRCRRRG